MKKSTVELMKLIGYGVGYGVLCIGAFCGGYYFGGKLVDSFDAYKMIKEVEKDYI